MPALSDAILAIFHASRPLAMTAADYAADHMDGTTTSRVSVAMLRQPRDIARDLTLRAYGLTQPLPSAHARLAIATAKAATRAAFQDLLDRIDAIPYLCAGPVRVLETRTPQGAQWLLTLMGHVTTHPTAAEMGTYLDTIATHLGQIEAGDRACTVTTPSDSLTATFMVQHPQDAVALWRAFVQPTDPAIQPTGLVESAWCPKKRGLIQHHHPLP